MKRRLKQRYISSILWEYGWVVLILWTVAYFGYHLLAWARR